MSSIAALAELVAGVRLSDIPEPLADKLRLHLFDTLGAATVGGRTAEAQAAAALVRDVSSSSDVPALGSGVRSSPALAALASCVAIRCTEVDDIHLESCTTPASVVVPTALALASADPAVDAPTFLAALLAGYEVLTRFGKAASGPAILYRGIWPTYLAARLGAAATAARMLALTPPLAANALATALALTAGIASRSLAGIPARWLTLGSAVEQGILAAAGARRGFEGDTDMLDGAWSRVTGIELDAAALVEALGSSYETARVSIKPYCSAKQATSSICCFLDMVDSEGLDPAGIEQIVVSVPRAYLAMIDQPRPPSHRLASIISVQYQLALAAYHRRELRDVLRPVLHDDPSFAAFMGKIRVQPDEELARHYPRAWPAKLEISTGAGRVSRQVEHTIGDPDAPFSWNDAIQKFEDVAGQFLTPAVTAKLAAACRGLGSSTELAQLLDLLAAI
ncbi:MAG: MmgE/PrpD family protein [Chloroflexota bacterium]|nr:MmgE/PrpD family protein [Chloroflexota bacterium]